MSPSPHNSPEDGGAGTGASKSSGSGEGDIQRFLKRLTKVVVVLAVLAAGTVAWFKWFYPTGTFRYRITVEVQVDDTVQTGSGVLEASFGIKPAILPRTGNPSSVRGEAVVVNMDNRGALFLLVKSNRWGTGAQHIPFQIFGFERMNPRIIRGLADMKAKGEIPFERLPMLVRFRDISDPKTVELVDPNDLAASFGPGVSLKRVTIETTKDPVTTGIKKRLMWLVNPKIDPGVRRRGLLTGDEDLVPGKPGITVGYSVFFRE